MARRAAPLTRSSRWSHLPKPAPAPELARLANARWRGGSAVRWAALLRLDRCGLRPSVHTECVEGHRYAAQVSTPLGLPENGEWPLKKDGGDSLRHGGWAYRPTGSSA